MHTHRYYQEMLPLSLYGDLSAPEKLELAQHLSTCSRCKKQLDDFRRLHHLLSESPVDCLNESLLPDARYRFQRAMGTMKQRPTVREQLQDILRVAVRSRAAMVFGGMVLFLLGVFGGRTLGTSSDNNTSLDSFLVSGGGLRVTNVQFVGTPSSAGDIELSFDAVKPVRLRGPISDPRIQKALAFALVKSDNPGVRIRAVGSFAATASALPEREVKTALLLALKTDQNDAVRKEALQAILRYQADRDVRDALLYVLLHDANPGLRIAAINGLDSLETRGYEPDDSFLKTLREKIQNDDNLYVRVKAQSILEEKTQ
jgi:HEAT repeat protein